MFKKIASNTIAQVLSKVLTAIISIFLLSILTNYLSVELFWVYSKVYNYLWIFAFLADLGLYTIMIREISKAQSPLLTSPKERGVAQVEKIVWNVLTLRIFLWSIIIFLALGVAYFLPWYNSKIELIAIAIVWFFTLISLINSTFLWYMQSQLKMEFSLFSVVFWKLVNLWIILLIVFIFLPVWVVGNQYFDSLLFILWAWLVWITINTILNYFYANRSCNIRMRFDLDYIKYIFKISLPYWIALFLSVVYFKIDIILLSLLEWEKADISIALYSLPMKIVEVLMVISWFYLNSILPKLTQLFEQKEKGQTQRTAPTENNVGVNLCVQPEGKELQNILILSFKILFSFGIIVFTFGTIFREHVIQIIANSNYINPSNHIFSSSDAFLIVLWILVFNAISLLFIYVFIWAKKQSILLKINIFITLFNIIWNMILIPKYSFIWAGIITLISQILLFVISFYYSRKIIKFSFPKIFILKILLLSAVFFVSLFYLISNYSLGLYLDVFVYGLIWIGLYSYIIVKELKK